MDTLFIVTAIIISIGFIVQSASKETVTLLTAIRCVESDILRSSQKISVIFACRFCSTKCRASFYGRDSVTGKADSVAVDKCLVQPNSRVKFACGKSSARKSDGYLRERCHVPT